MHVCLLSVSVLALVGTTFGEIRLRRASHTLLPNRAGTFTLNSRTAHESAFDEFTRYLYVVGRDTGLLHVLDIDDPANPVTFLTVKFDMGVYGRPLDVELCRIQSATPVALLAITFDGIDSVAFAGQLGLYHLITSQSGQLVEFNKAEPTFIVGAHPGNMQFTSDCSKIVIACEGEPREVEGNFVDPEGTVHIVTIPPTNASLPSDKVVDFTPYNNDPEYVRQLVAGGYRYWLTSDPVDSSKLITFAQNVEPEYVAISPKNGFAYVTLQENNAIARIDITLGIITDIYPMGTKHWQQLSIDASDIDGGPMCDSANIRTFYQPDKAVFLSWKSQNYLLTLDKGATVNIPGVSFTDYGRATALGPWNTGDSNLNNDLKTNARLGRMFLSSVDGINVTPQVPYGFGGRGFSIFETLSMSREWESGDQLEKYSREYYKDTFNGDCSSFSQTPVQQKDRTSPLHGPTPSAIGIGDWHGHRLAIVGSEKNGLLYVYEFLPNLDTPQPDFHSVYRDGSIDATWINLHPKGNMGDAGIRDIKFSQTGTKMVMVTSEISGSVSVYTFEDVC